MQTPENYYGYNTPEEGDNWGSYQYVSLKDIIDELLVESSDPDSYLSNTSRTKLLMAAKNGVRNLNREVKKNVKAVEMTVGVGLYIPLPQDYVDWLRISIITPDFKLQPLDVNRRLNTAIGYLQDHNAEILFDDNGNILTSDSSNAYAHPHKSYLFSGSYCQAGNKHLDTTKFSKWGECKIDNERGTIVFSSNLVNREVVLEYTSDRLENLNLREGKVNIHKLLKDALIAYIYSAVISKRRHVPYNEKLRAKREYKALRHKALMDVADFDFNELYNLKDSRQL